MNLVEQSRQRIKGHASLIDEQGRRKILKLLTETPDPWQSISDIQSSWSLNYPRAFPALSFLDILKCSRGSVYQSLLENMKEKLELQLAKITEESKLLIMLKETMPFMAIKELKQIPISIIKRLNNLPPEFLNALARRNNLADVPMPVRRQAWSLNCTLFVNTVEEHCRACLGVSDTVARRAGPAKQLCDSVGQSEILFTSCANFCAVKAAEEFQPRWGGIIRDVLMGMSTGGEKISSLGKLHDLAWLVDHSTRKGHIDSKDLIDILGYLKSLITTQASACESAFEKANAVARAAANLYKGSGAAGSSRSKGSKATEELFEEAPPPPPPPRSSHRDRDASKRKGTGSSSNRAANAASLGRRVSVPTGGNPIVVMKKCWDFLKGIDTGDVFAVKVTNSIAPNYDKIIRHPMDLSLILRKITGGSYRDFHDFDSDVCLMFNNCIKYNFAESYFGQLAKGFLKQWAQKKESLLEAGTLIDLNATTSTSNGSNSGSTAAATMAPSAGAKRTIEESSAVAAAKPASTAVTSSSTSSVSVSAVGANTQPPKEEEGERSHKRIKSDSGAAIPVKPPLSAPSSSSSSRAAPAAVAAKRPPALKLELDDSMDARAVLREALESAWQLLADADVESYFANPVSEVLAPGYFKAIKDPMDLSTMRVKMDRKKYKTLDAFSEDVRLMFNNAISFNEDHSEVTKAAKHLLSLWESSRTQLEEAIATGKSIVPRPPTPVTAPSGGASGAGIEVETKLESSAGDLGAVKTASNAATAAAEVVNTATTTVTSTAAALDDGDDECEWDESDTYAAAPTTTAPSTAAPTSAAPSSAAAPARTAEEIPSGNDTTKDADDQMDTDEGSVIQTAPAKIEKVDAATDAATDAGPDAGTAIQDALVDDKKNDNVANAAVQDTDAVKKGTVEGAGVSNTSASAATTTGAFIEAVAVDQGKVESTAMDVEVEAEVLNKNGVIATSDGKADVATTAVEEVPDETSKTSKKDEKEEKLAEGKDAEVARDGNAADTAEAKPVGETASEAAVSSSSSSSSSSANAVADTNKPVSDSATTEKTQTQTAQGATTLTAAASQPKAPEFKPPTHPTDRLLQTSRAAVAAIKAAPPNTAAAHHLPPILAEGKLLWAICILRDPQVQALIRRYLAGRLHDLLAMKDAKPILGGTAASAAARAQKDAILPAEDILTKLATQICQLSLTTDYAIHPMDEMLLRVELPLLMVEVARGRTDGEAFRKQQAQDAATATATAAAGDGDTAVDGSAVAEEPVLKAPAAIAKKVLEYSQKLQPAEKEDDKEQEKASASDPTAEVSGVGPESSARAAAKRARTILLENVSRHLLEKNAKL